MAKTRLFLLPWIAGPQERRGLQTLDQQAATSCKPLLRKTSQSKPQKQFAPCPCFCAERELAGLGFCRARGDAVMVSLFPFSSCPRTLSCTINLSFSSWASPPTQRIAAPYPLPAPHPLPAAHPLSQFQPCQDSSPRGDIPIFPQPLLSRHFHKLGDTGWHSSLALPEEKSWRLWGEPG